MTKTEQGKKLGQIVVKAWTDEAFKQRLLDDATTVLKEEGVLLPEGLTVRAVENSEKVFHLVIPPQAAATELSPSQLADIAAGCDPHCWTDKCSFTSKVL